MVYDVVETDDNMAVDMDNDGSSGNLGNMDID